MDADNLVVSFENSFCNEVVEFTGEIVEFGIDLGIDNEALKDVPFVGTAFKLYSIGNKVYDRHCLEKLYSFILSINDGSCSKELQERRREKFVENKTHRKQELDYIFLYLMHFCD